MTGDINTIGHLTDSDLDALFVNPPRSGVISAWYGHVPFAFWLMWSLRPRVFVELGTYNGNSYAAFCEAALAASIETRCYAVDTWHGDEHAGYYDESVYNSLQTFHDSRYSAFSRMMRTTFDEAAQYFADGSIDLLHIDGYHSHDAVLHDFEQWQPKLSNRAVVLFHDTNVRERHFGVWRLWANLRERYPSFEFVHEHGLGVLAVGIDVPDPVRTLCNLTDSATIAILRTRFAQSGRRCMLESELVRTQESLRAVERDAHAAQAALQETLKVAERDAEVAQCALAEKDLRIQNAEYEVQRLLKVATLGSRVRTVLDDEQRQLEEVRRDLAAKIISLQSITQSTIWTVLAPVRAIASGLPPSVRRQVRHGLRAAWWGLTPWRIPERLRMRRPALVALGLQPAAPLTPASIAGAFDSFALPLVAPLRGDYQPVVAWYDSVRPEVSIVISNCSQIETTMLCLRHIWQNTSRHRYEIIVVDNGSGAAQIDWLRKQQPMARIIPLGVNRCAGEANNIGVEAAQGRYVCLLRNDAFVSPGWLSPLIDILESDQRVGAVGPSFRCPDGSLQEAGALVNPDGSTVQLGKGARAEDPIFKTTRTVDYVSAACMLLRRDDFLGVLGFDLTWDPAYYEDIDLCLKLRLTGLRTIYCPDSVVIHTDEAAAAAPVTGSRLNTIVGINQHKFIARWAGYLKTMGREPPNLIPELKGPNPIPVGQNIRVLIFTPYNLTLGGGERYILSLAEAYRDATQVVLVTPHAVSRIRLLTLGREFGLDLRHVEPLCFDDFQTRPLFDLAFVLGNNIFPPVGRMAVRNIFICQFPFPLDDEAYAHRLRPFWNDFDLVVTYSEFVRSHVSRDAGAYGLAPRPIEVLAPPVPQIASAPAKRPDQILHVGRFFTGGHCKRQDALIDAFRGLIHAGVKAELHLAGSTHPEPEHQAYYLSLIEQARGLPVFFHASCSGVDLRQLYAESSIYWHATGVGGDAAVAPHAVEHFGISIVEAMSARCIPIVFAAGGPASIVEDGVTGFHFRTIDELTAKTQEVLENTPTATLNAIAGAAEVAARAYDEPTFKMKVRDISSRLMTTG